MIKIFIEDFITGHSSESLWDVMEKISDYCHAVATDIKIYYKYRFNFIHLYDESLTFPNVVYVQYLDIRVSSPDLHIMHPDLTEVGDFCCYSSIVSFGKIKEIGVFNFYRGYGGSYLSKQWLGNDMYRFTNEQTGEHWDFKIIEDY